MESILDIIFNFSYTNSVKQTLQIEKELIVL